MARRKRHLRRVIAAYLVTGAIVMQLGPVCSLAGGMGLASSAGTLIDANGRLLGLFNVCGAQDIVYTDAQGIPTGSVTDTSGNTKISVLYAGDDLMNGCPIQYVQAAGAGG